MLQSLWVHAGIFACALKLSIRAKGALCYLRTKSALTYSGWGWFNNTVWVWFITFMFRYLQVCNYYHVQLSQYYSINGIGHGRPQKIFQPGGKFCRFSQKGCSKKLKRPPELWKHTFLKSKGKQAPPLPPWDLGLGPSAESRAPNLHSTRELNVLYMLL